MSLIENFYLSKISDYTVLERVFKVTIMIENSWLKMLAK